MTRGIYFTSRNFSIIYISTRKFPENIQSNFLSHQWSIYLYSISVIWKEREHPSYPLIHYNPILLITLVILTPQTFYRHSKKNNKPISFSIRPYKLFSYKDNLLFYRQQIFFSFLKTKSSCELIKTTNTFLSWDTSLEIRHHSFLLQLIISTPHYLNISLWSGQVYTKKWHATFFFSFLFFHFRFVLVNHSSLRNWLLGYSGS